MSVLWLALALLVLILFLLYNFSTTMNYYMRISFFYATIFAHGMECTVTLFPSWLKQGGADLVFHKFYYWCFWTGVHVEVRDQSLMDKVQGPAVVIANHQSAIDVIVMSSVWPHRGVVMMKKALMYVPFFNIASYWANTIFIDRFNRERAMHSVDYCVEQLKISGFKLWVFPEGTRNRDGGMIPFKKGAFNIAVRAQIPIIPIVISDYRPFYSKNGKYFRTDGEVIAQVLPPIDTTGLSLDDVADLIEKTRSKMLAVYDVISPEVKHLIESKRKDKSE
ncbi:unnamed protein product [Caenorhabditis auriculariae]|uniref:1-acyl-sn-glycerol-3-phosphate acyltransferase n=1 Tax=Caenorhabditis auriculariae TaxID=2777116 RepID=A0A8S1GSA2_9PELO|nr:unnamed protein product [Caenorhabditis auriculariae]